METDLQNKHFTIIPNTHILKKAETEYKNRDTKEQVTALCGIIPFLC